MATFRDILKRLFSRNVIIKRLPGDRLKAYDVNNSQNNGSPNPHGYRNRWRNGRNYASVSGYGTGISNYEVEAIRKQFYLDYEMMDTDSIISSALDIYADECTSLSESGELLVIKTDNAEIKKILHNLFYDVLNIEFNLWSWIRQTCKFGDTFLYLEIDDKFGIVNVIPIHPSLMIREEGLDSSVDSIKFKYEAEGGFSYVRSTQNVFEYYEIAHFRLITDTNFLPYGRSALQGAKKDFKRLCLMEDSMMLHRIMRAPERRVFKIEVGNIPPEQVDAHMTDIIDQTKKTPYIDPETGDYNLKFNLMNMMDDYYLPVRGGDSGTSIETLPGLTTDGQMDDVEYIKTKMMSALKIPKSYLGYDEADSKSNLATIDARFARFIERLQKIIVSELYKIATIHLYANGYKDEDLLSFELNLTSPSLIYERQKVDLLNEKFNLIANVLETKLLSDKYIYENILGMTESEWKEQKDLVPNDIADRFRYKQIEEEGNDPAKTKRVYGTPHEIATLQVSSRFNANIKPDLERMYSPDERENNEGQPFKYKNFETDDDKTFGRDPMGRKDVAKGVEAEHRKFSYLKKMKTKQIKMLSEDQIL